MEYLQTDTQTIDDLRIFDNQDGIFRLYNQTTTHGGEALLDFLFRHPLSDVVAIRQRSRLIEEFAHLRLAFPFEAALFDMSEKYLAINAEQGGHKHASLTEKDLQNGVAALMALLQQLHMFINQPEIRQIKAYKEEREALETMLGDSTFSPVLRESAKGKLTYAVAMAYDELFRVRERGKIKQILERIYALDVYIAVASTARDRHFVFPAVYDKGSSWLSLEEVYHPSVRQAVGNTFSLGKGQHLVFLTGANMAGKSTFLRALSTALYLAHMGFPVAAQKMEFTVMDGMYTTINLPDNLGIGASHFYAEVLRLKQVAGELGKGKTLFVIFDELFRGTNVKDAHEATVEVTHAFARKKKSLFVISSHIVEAGEDLKKVPEVRFCYLPTRMNGHTPTYTYRLEEGITEDRHGMVIIRNEKILDLLREGKQRKPKQKTT